MSSTSSDNKPIHPTIAVVFFLLIGMCLGFIAGMDDGERFAQREAVLVGHAHWDHDQKGRAVFKWNPILEPFNKEHYSP